MLVCLNTIYDCFLTTRAELRGYNHPTANLTN